MAKKAENAHWNFFSV